MAVVSCEHPAGRGEVALVGPTGGAVGLRVAAMMGSGAVVSTSGVSGGGFREGVILDGRSSVRAANRVTK